MKKVLLFVFIVALASCANAPEEDEHPTVQVVKEPVKIDSVKVSK